MKDWQLTQLIVVLRYSLLTPNFFDINVSYPNDRTNTQFNTRLVMSYKFSIVTQKRIRHVVTNSSPNKLKQIDNRNKRRS